MGIWNNYGNVVDLGKQGEGVVAHRWFSGNVVLKWMVWPYGFRCGFSEMSTTFQVGLVFPSYRIQPKTK